MKKATEFCSISGAQPGQCSESLVCEAVPACNIGGKWYREGDPDATGCKVCVPSRSTTAWSLKPSGTQCPGGTCSATGACTQLPKCTIDGKQYIAWQKDETGCRYCDPTRTTTAWSFAPSGKSCENGGTCDSSGQCIVVKPTCTIDGTTYDHGVRDAGGCKACEANVSTSRWTALADGSSCAEGGACRQGFCVPPPPPEPATGEFINRNINGVPFEFVYIRAGTFIMGAEFGSDPEIEPEEAPQHLVTLTKPFLLMRHEVTQWQFQWLMGRNPSEFQTDSWNPVERVSWNDARAFVDAMSAAAGKPQGTYRLPTEAQWEFAARAGTTGSRYGYLPDIAWFDGTASGQPMPVMWRQPNAWGLYDMLGNVFEWTEDSEGEYSSSAQIDPVGVGGANRIYRGGSFYAGQAHVRASGPRFFGTPDYTLNQIGFRVAMPVPTECNIGGTIVTRGTFDSSGCRVCDPLQSETDWTLRPPRSLCETGICAPDGTCQPHFCGDGTKNPGEECDDGNDGSGDGCSDQCVLEITPDQCVPLTGLGRSVVACPVWTIYSVAKESCRKLGGVIAEPQSADDSVAMGQAAAPWANGGWIGLTDEKTEGTFVWESGRQLPQSSWRYGEPNDWSNEDCVHLFDDGGWNDLSCFTARPFICELSETPPASACVINGANYRAGQSDASGCRACDPAQSTTSWSLLSAGTSCSGGGTCDASGACLAYGPVSPTLSSVTLSHSVVAADGTSATTVMIRLVDEQGRFIPNAQPFMTASPSTGVGIVQPAPSGSDGNSIGQVTSQRRGFVTLAISVNGTTLTASPVIDFVCPSGTQDNDNDGVCAVPPTRRVFVTNQTFTGSLGGVLGADSKCNQAASAAGLRGSFRAWIADGAGSAPASRFTRSADPYVRMDGVQVAADWADLTDGNLSNAINVTETGVNVNGRHVWTGGVSATGGFYSGGPTCSAWLSSGIFSIGDVGVSGNLGLNWSSWGGRACSSSASLICFEQ